MFTPLPSGAFFGRLWSSGDPGPLDESDADDMSTSLNTSTSKDDADMSFESDASTPRGGHGASPLTPAEENLEPSVVPTGSTSEETIAMLTERLRKKEAELQRTKGELHDVKRKLSTVT